VQVLLEIVLSVILLANVAFDTVYVAVGPSQRVSSGIAPFNSSLAFSNYGVNSLPTWFGYESQGLLLDPTRAITFPPTTNDCIASGNDCYSYVLPSALEEAAAIPANFTPVYPSEAQDAALAMQLEAEGKNETIVNQLGILNYSAFESEGATTYVIVNQPAYQLEFFPTQGEPTFEDSDCQVLGLSDTPLRLCLKNGVANNLIAGNETIDAG